MLLTAGVASAATIGSNLATAPNDSLCKFEVLEPKTETCFVGHSSLVSSHTAVDGLTAPIDGVIVRWSVVSGSALPGTGRVTLGLRLTHGPGSLEKGPDVELPLGSPGRHTYAERMPISAGQPIGLKVVVENRSVQEAGAPIAFREDGVGTIDTWTGEPWSSSAIWNQEEDVELLLDAEIEPDADRDGFGDLTQDCFPSHFGDQHLCGRDFAPPVVKSRFARRQAFLRSGTVSVRVSSNEAGRVRASGELQIKGGKGWTYGLRGARKSVAPGGQAILRLQVRPRALKAARLAAAEGKRVVVTGRVGVQDASGNEGQAPFRVRLRSN